jgi:hypothetical protein
MLILWKIADTYVLLNGSTESMEIVKFALKRCLAVLHLCQSSLVSSCWAQASKFIVFVKLLRVTL